MSHYMSPLTTVSIDQTVQRVVAGLSRDADDLRDLLTVLGYIPWPDLDEPESAEDQCGTNLGYQRHRRNKEEPCDQCKSAQSMYAMVQKFLKGTITDPFRCKGCGSVFRNSHRCHLQR